MTLIFKELILGLFMADLGIALGAGLYEYRVVLPLWFSPQADNGLQVNRQLIINIDSGRKFWAFATTMPLTLLTIASIILAFQISGPVHNWWLAAALITLIERIGTFTYFIPTIIKLTQVGKYPDSKLSHKAAQWKNMNLVRIGLNLAGFICAMAAFSMIGNIVL